MLSNEKIDVYGTGTVGEKGQIVIPAAARKAMGINPGDNFIFFSHGPLIHMVRADQLNELIDKATKKFTSHLNGLKDALQQPNNTKKK
ncbi:MAG: AbrB/MazE/SpoVT family DNA-binding domain-containing protein [Candidatus Kerfeldbacteria bacterium]